MSDNKFRYYRVTSETIVKANSKTDAQTLAGSSRSRVPGSVLTTESIVERIPATTAHAATA